MHTDSQNAVNLPPFVRFGKFRHVMLGSVLSVMVMLMMSACSDDEMEQQVESQADEPAEPAVVQPAPAQWSGQYRPQPYVAPPVQQRRVPAPVTGNPWAVRTQPRSYGQQSFQQWGQPQPRPPQYVQPEYAQPQHVQPQYAQQQHGQQHYVQPQYVQPQYVQPQYVQPQYVQPQYVQPQYAQPQYAQPQYRPLEPETEVTTRRAPTAQQPVQSYQPVAPYDRISGSSFVTPAYPYGSAYPGTYGSGLYGAPGGIYAPGWPGRW